MPVTGSKATCPRGADPAQSHHEDPQRVQAALIHQGARHHPIVDEMADHEPIAGMNVSLRANESQAPLAPRGIEGRHPVNQAHPAAGQRQRIVQIDAVKRRAECRREIASSQCIDLDLIEPRRRQSGSSSVSSAVAGGGFDRQIERLAGQCPCRRPAPPG